jgi:hypothetical protein
VSDFGPHDHGSADSGEREPIGTVGEEAAKLLVALQGWTREHLADASRAASDLGSSYISDGSAACRVCPVCQLIAFVRGVNPESLEQMSHAAGSMLNALAGLVDAAHRSDTRRGSPVEKINLTDDDPGGPQ